IKGLRDNIKFSTTTNPKLDQWVAKQISEMVEYKSKSVGIVTGYQEESYISRRCPSCGKRHQPKARNFNCEGGFNYHRERVGALNILKKYTINTLEGKSNRLEGELSLPWGVSQIIITYKVIINYF
ncbi:MAG: zinc ribbon domain-containing protein, partial [Halanaerobiales bacterium]